MNALILIGGLGTRLRPLTCSRPKPLMPIVNRPFLYYQLQLIKKHGIRDVLFCVSYLPEAFKRCFGNGKKLGLRIRYIHEQKPLGTGGAIKNAEQMIRGPVVVFNGDIFTDIPLSDVIEFHKKNRAFATIALTRVKDPTSYGLIETDRKGRITRFIEKPTWDEVTCNTVNAGTYIFQPEVLNFIPKNVNYSVERGLFPLLLQKGFPLYGYVYSGYWLDMGTTENYLQASIDCLEGRISHPLPGKKIRKTVWAGKGTKIHQSAALHNAVVCGHNTAISEDVLLDGPLCIGNNCRVGRKAVIERSVVLDNCVIGEGARIEHSVIGSRCVIEPHARLRSGTVLGDNTVIKRYSKV